MQVMEYPSKVSTLALKQRADVTRGPKTRVSVTSQKGLLSTKNCRKKIKEKVTPKHGRQGFAAQMRK